MRSLNIIHHEVPTSTYTAGTVYREQLRRGTRPLVYKWQTGYLLRVLVHMLAQFEKAHPLLAVAYCLLGFFALPRARQRRKAIVGRNSRQHCARKSNLDTCLVL